MAIFKDRIKILAQGTTSSAGEKVLLRRLANLLLPCAIPEEQSVCERAKGKWALHLWSCIMSLYWKGDEGYG